MITKKLKELVRDEAEKLRKFAPPKARARLDFEMLDPEAPRACIYGQMTGMCYSDYATKLLNQCARPFSRELEDYVNGSIVNQRFSSKHRREAHLRNQGELYFSAIEFYICQNGAKNNNLIRYIKGETDVLKI